MTTLLQFIAHISIILYALAAAGIFFAIRGLFQARRARRVAVFGLEREAAREQTRRSTSSLITLVLLVGAVYIVENIVVPNLSEAPETPTPTPVVFVTRQVTATPLPLLFPTITPTVGLPPAEVVEGEETPEETINGCEIEGTTITSPAPGDIVSGQVAVEGVANILYFAGYKFEVNGPSTAGAWAVVATYNEPVFSGLLGVWDSTSLAPGNYTLRLVVFREDGTYLTPCEVPIVVAGRGGAIPAPTP